jgi:putative SOS response-associated peptidase YedK
MPAILKKEYEKRWLSEDLKREDINFLLEPIDDSGMEAYPVSKMISYKKENTNVPEVRDKVEYEELKTEQVKLF